ALAAVLTSFRKKSEGVPNTTGHPFLLQEVGTNHFGDTIYCISLKEDDLLGQPQLNVGRL
ncbi:hypothetical protein, partial [Geobacillus stearothermophilus]|uniref:hypothetical protein n=1 Tax=Geobacillus stearothermophilus TaxID=1422 RepID=UPI003D190A1A